MKGLVIGIALGLFVSVHLAYGLALLRRMRRRGEPVRIRDAALGMLANALWLSAAAGVLWALLNVGP